MEQCPERVRSVICSVKGCSRCTNAIAIYFSQLVGWMGFGVIVTIAPCEHLHWIHTTHCDKKITVAIVPCEQPFNMEQCLKGLGVEYTTLAPCHQWSLFAQCNSFCGFSKTIHESSRNINEQSSWQVQIVYRQEINQVISSLLQCFCIWNIFSLTSLQENSETRQWNDFKKCSTFCPAQIDIFNCNYVQLNCCSF